MAELASQPTSIQSVYALYRDSKLFVNRRYQRKLVWTQLEKQKLIESIMKKYPIPAILLAEREDVSGSYEIIDGLQRLHAIVSFIETSFPTLEGAIFDILHFPTAKNLADEKVFEPNVSESLLTQREVSTILDYNLAASVMRGSSEEEINDVFDRINTYGHRLSDQERRQAGVQNEFSNMVRLLACTLRGDSTADILPLRGMPAISIDLPMTKHGYEVQADEVFWVNQGILLSTDLRDSMDEQCIADVAACMVGGQIIERSKDALDEIYRKGSDDSDRVLTALEIYGSNKIAAEFKFCVEEILKVSSAERSTKLRDVLFRRRNTNAFPSIFAVIMVAFYELTVKDKKKIADYAGVKRAITYLSERIDTGRRATAPDERRKNIDTIKGLISSCFVETTQMSEIYGNHTVTDIESIIRRSQIELADYELKQEMLSLSDVRAISRDIIEKVVSTICAIANNGQNRSGRIIIGVTDKLEDAERVKQLDHIEPKKIGRRYVVGVSREAKALNISLEKYFSLWKDGIKNSELSAALKYSIMSNIDFNDFFGLGIIVINIQPQTELSYVGEVIYWRNADSTEMASSARQIATLAKRFSK